MRSSSQFRNGARAISSTSSSVSVGTSDLSLSTLLGFNWACMSGSTSATAGRAMPCNGCLWCSHDRDISMQ